MSLLYKQVVKFPHVSIHLKDVNTLSVSAIYDKGDNFCGFLFFVVVFCFVVVVFLFCFFFLFFFSCTPVPSWKKVYLKKKERKNLFPWRHKL